MATRDLVIEILAKELRRTPEEIAAAETLGALGIESLDMVSVVMALEDALSIHLSDRALQDVRSIDDLVGLIDRTKAGHGAS